MTRNRNKRMSLAQKYTRFIDEHQAAELDVLFKFTRTPLQGDIEKLISRNIAVAAGWIVGKSRVKTVEIKKGMKLTKLELFAGSYTITFSDNSKHTGLFTGYGKIIKASFKLLTLIIGRKECRHGH